MKNKEIWKDIYFEENGVIWDYRGLYQVSNLGRVKSLKFYCNANKKYYDRELILKLRKDKYGYMRVMLSKDNKRYFFTVHKLVGKTFLDNPNSLPQINHINGIKSDNRIRNLEYCTAKENTRHAFKIGLCKRKHRGEHHFARRVIQYDLLENFIKRWDCIMDIEEQLKINGSNIGQCCRGKRKTAGGFRWEYSNEK